MSLKKKEILVVDNRQDLYESWIPTANGFNLEFQFVNPDSPIESGLKMLQGDLDARICGVLSDSLEEYQEPGQLPFSHIGQLLKIRSNLDVGVYSGNRQEERVKRAFQLGAVAFIRKSDSLEPYFELVTSKKPLPKQVRQVAKSYVALNLGSGMFPEKVSVVEQQNGQQVWRVKVFATSDKRLVGTLKVSDDCRSQVWLAQNQLATSA